MHCAAALLLALLSGCGTATGPADDREQPGVIAFHSDPVMADVPDAVVRGQTFTVSIRTYGGGCIRKGRTAVRSDDLLATVMPIDTNTRGDVCTAELALYTHEASLRFDRAGIATIVFSGTKWPEDEPFSVVRTVLVR